MSKLTKADWLAILRYNRKSGYLDVDNPKILTDPGSIDRLLAHNMIEKDGRLTPEGIRKCVLMEQRLKIYRSKGIRAQNIPGHATERQGNQLKLKSKDIVASSNQPKPLEVKDIESKEVTERHLVPLEDETVEKENREIDKNLITINKPASFEAEQFRMLRSNIMFPVNGKPPRLIMVTSAAPGEGKSFVSANLAITFAQDLNTHVLLMDCDMRRSTILTRFGYGKRRGLSEYLRRKTTLPSILVNTDYDKLTILPGGTTPRNPSELIASRRMSILLEEVKNRYQDRYVIIDSPPPKLTAETSVLARQVDGIILVAKYGSTRKDDLAELIEKLGEDKIMGVIINWYNLRASRYYGYGGYGSYGRYYRRKS